MHHTTSKFTLKFGTELIMSGIYIHTYMYPYIVLNTRTILIYTKRSDYSLGYSSSRTSVLCLLPQYTFRSARSYSASRRGILLLHFFDRLYIVPHAHSLECFQPTLYCRPLSARNYLYYINSGWRRRRFELNCTDQQLEAQHHLLVPMNDTLSKMFHDF